MIRKEAYVHKAVMEELRRIIEDSEVRTLLIYHLYCYSDHVNCKIQIRQDFLTPAAKKLKLKLKTRAKNSSFLQLKRNLEKINFKNIAQEIEQF